MVKFKKINLLRVNLKFTNLTEKPQGKYPGAGEKTKRYIDLLSNKGYEHLWEELEPVRKGDMINLHDLLFTKNRDYLVKYNDDQQVC